MYTHAIRIYTDSPGQSEGTTSMVRFLAQVGGGLPLVALNISNSTHIHTTHGKQNDTNTTCT